MLEHIVLKKMREKKYFSYTIGANLSKKLKNMDTRKKEWSSISCQYCVKMKFLIIACEILNDKSVGDLE